MKQRIFNRGRGWYVSASNYKNQEDKAYMNVFFPNGTEPHYQPVGEQGFTFIDIDIKEQKYTAYQGKIGLTVFKYEIIPAAQNGLNEVERQNNEFAQQLAGTEYENKFGSSVSVQPDDLPFY